MATIPRRRAFGAGLADIAPILIGVFPFGLIAGIAAVEAGLDRLQAILTSSIVFAGASQLAAMDLVARDAAPIVIVTTALVINSRFAMYSASLAPHLRGLGGPATVASAYLLTDQAFAVSIVRFPRESWEVGTRFAYYAGASMGLWTTWQISSIVGVVVGAGVPDSWSLDFAIPLVFLALVFPAIKDRGTRVAALVAAVVAAAAHGLPLNLGLLVAAAAGIAAGLAAERERA